MRPMTSSYDTDQADAIAQASKLWNPDAAQIGERLRQRDMTLADDREQPERV